MKAVILFLLAVPLLLSSSTHHHETNYVKGHYSDYRLIKPSEKKAKAVYRCTCENRDWRQDAAKKKACPYCGPAMAKCGYLVKVVPARNVQYDKSEYDLPNSICPVSSKPVENQKHAVEINGMKIYVCCKSCLKKFEKAIKENKFDKYLRNLPLRPELFGFEKAKSN